MKFPKKILQDLAYDGHDGTAFEVIKDEIYDHSRWSVGHTLIFRCLRTNKFYITYYSRGATEYQDESPFEYSDAEVDCTEVEPKKVEVTQYVEVKEGATDESVPTVE